MTERSVPSAGDTDTLATRIDNAAPTAADAAVLQLAVETSPQRPSEQQNHTDRVATNVVSHPSARLHDITFATALPALAVIAQQKNVAVTPDEQVPVLRHALEHISRRTMRRVLKGDAQAVLSLQLAISHSLDVLAAARMIGALEALQGHAMPDAATLIARGEAEMKRGAANDKSASIRIWPDLATLLNDYGRRMDEDSSPSTTVTLPIAVTSRVTVSQSTRLWREAVRAATPDREGLRHE